MVDPSSNLLGRDVLDRSGPPFKSPTTVSGDFYISIPVLSVRGEYTNVEGELKNQ